MASTEKMWEQFVNGVRRFVSKRVPFADVDDVVQDIFIRAHRNRLKLREEERAEAWILAIARKAIAGYYRQRQGELSRDSLERRELPDEAVKPPQNLSSYTGEHDVHEEVVSWLRPMADEIEEPYRSALIKADFEKISQRKLARELGISESGLKSRVQRARKRLAEILQRCCEVEFGTEGRAVAFRRLRECHCDS
ncbi:MAG: hypothetical protein DME42_06170 [Verrucomicrobia bacterium]|nr:MAG: hypothetical protein DME42_06170 [Verrucomicrobiota bacterium]